jgi:hypothetical protein
MLGPIWSSSPSFLAGSVKKAEAHSRGTCSVGGPNLTLEGMHSSPCSQWLKKGVLFFYFLDLNIEISILKDLLNIT